MDDYEPPKQLNPLGVALVSLLVCGIAFPIVLFGLWVVTGLMLYLFG